LSAGNLTGALTASPHGEEPRHTKSQNGQNCQPEPLTAQGIALSLQFLCPLLLGRFRFLRRGRQRFVFFLQGLLILFLPKNRTAMLVVDCFLILLSAIFAS